MVLSSRQWVQKQRKIFCQRSQERSEELSAMRCQESAASKRDSMDEEGQKYKVAYCSDRYTENRDNQFGTESWHSLEASGVFSAVLLHLHA